VRAGRALLAGESEMKSLRILYVVPVFNAEPWLCESIGSLQHQEGVNVEIFCVDDGSTDGSLALLERLAQKDGRIRVCSQSNAGPGAAFNRGLRFALENSYTYIGRMDADDISLPSRTRLQAKVLVENPDVAACGCNAIYFSEERGRCGESRVPTDSEGILREINAGGRGVIQGSAIFRAAALEAVGGYRTEKTPAEDTDIFLRLSERYPLCNVPESLYRIRICEKSHSLSNIRATRLYHHYYLALAKRRAEHVSDIPVETFVKNMDFRQRWVIRRETWAIVAYFRWMVRRSLPALSVAILLDPVRAARRIRKSLSGAES
jgi:glycosyltransferase involved in cell wall biosynthesis